MILQEIKNTTHGQLTVKLDADDVFHLGLKHWENFETGQNLKKAKSLVGIAKHKGHPLAEMFWEIICAFEEVRKF